MSSDKPLSSDAAVLKGQFAELRSRGYLLHLEIEAHPERATDISNRLEALELEAIELMKQMMNEDHLLYP